MIKPLLFNPPDCHDTLKRYADLMSFLITAHVLIHTGPDSILPKLLNAAQLDSVETLKTLLLGQEEVPNSTLDSAVHEVLTGLLIHRCKGSQINIRKEPVMMGLVWYNWKEDGSFKRPGEITQTFAAVQFVSRSAALMETFWRTESSREVEPDYYP